MPRTSSVFRGATGRFTEAGSQVYVNNDITRIERVYINADCMLARCFTATGFQALRAIANQTYATGTGVLRPVASYLSDVASKREEIGLRDMRGIESMLAVMREHKVVCNLSKRQSAALNHVPREQLTSCAMEK